MKKRVLLVVPSITGGGFEKAAVDTAKTLKEFCEVKLVVFHRHEVEYETDCEIISFDVNVGKNFISKFFNQLKRISMLKKLRKSFKPNVVYSFGRTAGITNVFSKTKNNGKTVVAVHGYGQATSNFTAKIIYTKADVVSCVSKEIKEKIEKTYPKIKHCVTIENGYPIDEIISKSEELVTFDKADINLVAMGRLDKVKGFNRLIRAFSLVDEKIKNAKLFFLGSGAEEQELKALAKSLNIEDKVKFLGFQKNPYAFLSKMDVFVMSSYSEGFPNSIIESMACQTPVISVDCKSGPKEILREEFSNKEVKNFSLEKYGILTQNFGDDEAVSVCLANAILYAVSNKELLSEYKNLSIKRARCFSLVEYRRKFEKLFQLIEG